ncbi:molecular chaperone [Bryobacter aggregatus]|uniref:fimbrial biogenesis chaperone n=1 Tax=Bryobacter aggregatus TaxID=360054 RepID=UPI0004E11DF7|nr:fimbria/pilus periplasmic chaperone [Bryobacter aggregatus]
MTPIRVELSSRKPTNLILVENRSEAERDYQIDAVQWKQRDGEDLYTPTNALIVMPPRFRLKPGGTQTIRIGTQLKSNAEEQAFRLYIQELPLRADPNESPSTMVQTLLRVGIPIFLAAEHSPAPPGIEAVLRKAVDGRFSLQLRNPSAVHVQLHSLKLGETAPISISRYLLPGQNFSLPLPMALPEGQASVPLEAGTDQGTFYVPLVLESHP